MIQENIRRLLSELPAHVGLVGAAKTRSPAEIMSAIEAGLEIIGENYVQEAENAFRIIGQRAKWHMIGHLQTNKVKKAVQIFDMVETVDSVKLAYALDKACKAHSKSMPILIEINSGEEEQKAGVMPESAVQLIREISGFENVMIMGLMTMGPFWGDPEDARPFFKKTKGLFDEVMRMDIPGVTMKYLSMGMSNSFRVAIEEGANLVRIGTKLFGER